MLEKPALHDQKLIDCLRDHYGFSIAEIEFLPLGADMNTAVYKAMTTDALPYFVKLRRGAFDGMSVEIPKFLHDTGIQQIIAPLPTTSRSLWAALDEYNVIVYPFVEGQNGWHVALSEDQWHTFGHTLKQIHTVELPADLKARLPREMYSPYWREEVKQFQRQVESTTYADPSAAGLAQLFRDKQVVISHLIKRAEDLAAVLQGQAVNDTLCHTDLHMGNLLVCEDGHFYIVDWDQPLLAPKERDLMFIASGIGDSWLSPEQEEAVFYAGYGQTAVDPVALAYYRYERIVQDFAAYGEQLFLTDEGGADRPEALRRVASQFEAGAVIEMAYRTERLLPSELRDELTG
jgi:spectinomycin phosphotransferase